MRSFQTILPRVYELKDSVDPSHPDAYFQRFEPSLDENERKLDAFVKLERQLTVLDPDAWSDLKGRASVHLISKAREQGRGWQALFDVFSEARAFGYLLETGCEHVSFIKREDTKTPDLMATRDGTQLFCEVKTINVSADQAEKRQRIGRGEFVSGATSLHVGDKFLNKLTTTLEHAVLQLDSVDPHRGSQRMIFTVVHFDDWIGDYQDRYFAQMDEHLVHAPVAAELVFCPGSNLFGRRFSMRAATVLGE